VRWVCLCAKNEVARQIWLDTFFIGRFPLIKTKKPPFCRMGRLQMVINEKKHHIFGIFKAIFFKYGKKVHDTLLLKINFMIQFTKFSVKL
jgi:hypothetical protein